MDLTTLQVPETPRKIFDCHAGPIFDMDVADWGPYVVTCGKKGLLHVNNYHEKKLIVIHCFTESCTRLKWLSTSVSRTILIIFEVEFEFH